MSLEHILDPTRVRLFISDILPRRLLPLFYVTSAFRGEYENENKVLRTTM
jgi:hypothetical protein